MDRREVSGDRRKKVCGGQKWTQPRLEIIHVSLANMAGFVVFIVSQHAFYDVFIFVFIFVEDLYRPSWISLNSLVFIIHQLVDRKPELTLLPTQRTFNLPHHIDMACEQLAF